MFECQTLCLAHVKASVEDSDRKVELAPAERNTRVLNQKAKMKGPALVGQLECSYAPCDCLGATLERDSPMYLEPHKFDARAAEVDRERPGKDPLALSQALQRRAPACDLIGACSCESVHSWQSFLLDWMQQQAPPGWSRPTIEQVLRTDCAAWVRVSEQLKTLRKGSSGNLSLDSALYRLTSDPHVLFHLLPLKGSESKPEKPDRPPKVPPIDPDKKRKSSGSNKRD